MKYLLFFIIIFNNTAYAKIKIYEDKIKRVYLLDAENQTQFDYSTMIHLQGDYFISGDTEVLNKNEKAWLLSVPVSTDYFVKKELLNFSKLVSGFILFGIEACLYLENFSAINSGSFQDNIATNLVILGFSTALFWGGFRLLEAVSNNIQYQKFPLVFHVEKK